MNPIGQLIQSQNVNMNYQQYKLFSAPFVLLESERGTVIAVNSTETNTPVILYEIPKEEFTNVWANELCKDLRERIKTEFNVHKMKHSEDHHNKKGIQIFTPRYVELNNFLTGIIIKLIQSIQIHFKITSLVSKLTLKIHVDGLSAFIHALDPTVNVNVERLNILNERILYDMFMNLNALKLDHPQPVFDASRSKDVTPLFQISFLNYTTYGITAYVKKSQQDDNQCIVVIDHKTLPKSPDFIEHWKKTMKKRIEFLRSDEFMKSKMAQAYKPLKMKTVK